MDKVRPRTLSDTLRRSARRFPGRQAVVCGDDVWTYAELEALVTRVAAGLVAEGVERGENVAVLSRNSHTFVAMRYALARMGAVIVPINFMLNAEEIAYILRHCGARRLCVDSELAEVAVRAIRIDTQVRQMIWLPGPEKTPQPAETISFWRLAECSDELSIPGPDPDDLVQIIYTSGTESRPKGAMLSHQAVLAQYLSCLVDCEIAETDRTVHALPLFHCAQLDVFLGPNLQIGAENHILAAPVPDTLLTLIETQRMTSFFAPPTVWISLLRSARLGSVDLSSLKKGYYGASIMPVEVLRELQERLPQLRLWNCYGQTEMAPLATVLKPEDQLRKPGSAGRPVLHVETRVVREDGGDVAVGEIGEVVHRSPHLMRGYFRDPAATTAAFAGGWFHSGDLATIDEDDYITIVDRKKDMIKTGGENVSSREVEEALYQHPAVSEVAVIGLPDPRWIEAVTAIVVLRSGYEASEAELIAHTGSLLASYKRPKRIVLTESLPKNASGKILKRQLRSEHN